MKKGNIVLTFILLTALSAFVASFLFLYKNRKCVVLQSEIEKQYGILITLINQSAQGLIQGGIAYAQESSAPEGTGGTVKHARVASKSGYNPFLKIFVSKLVVEILVARDV